MGQDSSATGGDPGVLTSPRSSTRLAPLVTCVGGHSAVARAERLYFHSPRSSGGSHADRPRVSGSPSPPPWRCWSGIAQPDASAQTKFTIGNAGGLERRRGAEGVLHTAFAAANKVQIQEESFNQELAKIRSQVETGNLIWDIVTTTAINVATGCEEGLCSRRWIGPSTSILKLFRDVGGVSECGVPYLFVSGGLAYDGNRIKDGPKTPGRFLNVTKWPGKRGLLYRAEQTFEIALMARRRAARQGDGGAGRAGRCRSGRSRSSMSSSRISTGGRTVPSRSPSSRRARWRMAYA